MKAFKRKKRCWNTIYNFTRLADAELIIDVNEEQMIPIKMKFENFVEKYQTKHFEKYGRKLKY